MRTLTALCLCLALLACQSSKDSATNALDTVGGETDKSYNKLREMVGLDHPPPPKPTKAETRYCYKTYNDVICYSKPLPGEEYRLVGYQEANGKTGYVIDPKDEKTVDGAAVKPASPPPLKSVAVGPPPAVKGDADQKQLKEIIFDPAELEPKELVPDKPQ